MELGRHVARLIGEHSIDHRMHVLVARLRPFTPSKACRDTTEAAFERSTLLQREDASRVQAHRPRLGYFDILRPETKIDSDGIVQRLKRGRGGRPEAATPQPVRRRTGPGSHDGIRLRARTWISGRHANARAGLFEEPFSDDTAGDGTAAGTAISRSLSARTRAGSAMSRIKPAASLCSYTSSSPNVTKRSSYSACSLVRPAMATLPLNNFSVTVPETRCWVTRT